MGQKRIAAEECTSNCPCGEHCTNQRFQRKQYAKIKQFWTKKKGYGLFADELIGKGDFITEYVGEVISAHEASLRFERDENHSYIVTLGNGRFIDATYKGNISRFINHSCNPNCNLETWFVSLSLSSSSSSFLPFFLSSFYFYQFLFFWLVKSMILDGTRLYPDGFIWLPISLPLPFIDSSMI